jgi:hypothetical protein
MTNPIRFCRTLFCEWKNCRHLCRSVLLIFMLCLATATDLRAEITWLEAETEFDYNIDILSSFFYQPNNYFEDYNNSSILNETSASLDSVAEVQDSTTFDVPQPGSNVQILAQAMGPENGTHPTDGLMVQAFLSTVATGLNAQQGVDIDLEAVSRVIRLFEVNQQENYRVKVELTGQTNFDDFYVDDQFRAFYSIRTEVRLEQIVGTGDQMEVQTMPGFPVVLDEANRTATVAVQLRPTDDQLRPITYRIKTELELNSRIDNFTLNGFVVAGNVSGNYQVGSLQAPFSLKALLKPGNTNTSSAINLLLFSD